MTLVFNHINCLLIPESRWQKAVPAVLNTSNSSRPTSSVTNCGWKWGLCKDLVRFGLSFTYHLITTSEPSQWEDLQWVLFILWESWLKHASLPCAVFKEGPIRMYIPRKAEYDYISPLCNKIYHTIIFSSTFFMSIPMSACHIQKHCQCNCQENMTEIFTQV